MFLVNVISMHVLPRIVEAEILQSKLNLDFIKFANNLFCIMSTLKSPQIRIGVSGSGFIFGKITLNCFRVRGEHLKHEILDCFLGYVVMDVNGS
jgi:hypothetical protein